MYVSVLVHKNHMMGEKGGYIFRELVQIFYHHAPKVFLQIIMINDLFQSEIVVYQKILILNFRDNLFYHKH